MRGAAAGEGLMTTGMTSAAITDYNAAHPEERTALQGVGWSVPAGLSTSGIAYLGGRLGGNVEAAVFNKGATSQLQGGWKGLRNAVVTEGAEEMAQAPGEQISQNIGTDQPWYQGLGSNMAESGLMGGVSGGGMHALARHRWASPNAERPHMPQGPANVGEAAKGVPAIGSQNTPQASAIDQIIQAAREQQAREKQEKEAATAAQKQQREQAAQKAAADKAAKEQERLAKEQAEKDAAAARLAAFRDAFPKESVESTQKDADEHDARATQYPEYTAVAQAIYRAKHETGANKNFKAVRKYALTAMEVSGGDRQKAAEWLNQQADIYLGNYAEANAKVDPKQTKKGKDGAPVKRVVRSQDQENVGEMFALAAELLVNPDTDISEFKHGWGIRSREALAAARQRKTKADDTRRKDIDNAIAATDEFTKAIAEEESKQEAEARFSDTNVAAIPGQTAGAQGSLGLRGGEGQSLPVPETTASRSKTVKELVANKDNYVVTDPKEDVESSTGRVSKEDAQEIKGLTTPEQGSVSQQEAANEGLAEVQGTGSKGNIAAGTRMRKAIEKFGERVISELQAMGWIPENASRLVVPDEYITTKWAKQFDSDMSAVNSKTASNKAEAIERLEAIEQTIGKDAFLALKRARFNAVSNKQDKIVAIQSAARRILDLSLRAESNSIAGLIQTRLSDKDNPLGYKQARAELKDLFERLAKEFPIKERSFSGKSFADLDRATTALSEAHATWGNIARMLGLFDRGARRNANITDTSREDGRYYPAISKIFKNAANKIYQAQLDREHEGDMDGAYGSKYTAEDEDYLMSSDPEDDVIEGVFAEKRSVEDAQKLESPKTATKEEASAETVSEKKPKEVKAPAKPESEEKQKVEEAQVVEEAPKAEEKPEAKEGPKPEPKAEPKPAEEPKAEEKPKQDKQSEPKAEERPEEQTKKPKAKKTASRKKRTSSKLRNPNADPGDRTRAPSWGRKLSTADRHKIRATTAKGKEIEKHVRVISDDFGTYSGVSVPLHVLVSAASNSKVPLHTQLKGLFSDAFAKKVSDAVAIIRKNGWTVPENVLIVDATRYTSIPGEIAGDVTTVDDFYGATDEIMADPVNFWMSDKVGDRAGEISDVYGTPLDGKPTVLCNVICPDNANNDAIFSKAGVLHELIHGIDIANGEVWGANMVKEVDANAEAYLELSLLAADAENHADNARGMFDYHEQAARTAWDMYRRIYASRTDLSSSEKETEAYKRSEEHRGKEMLANLVSLYLTVPEARKILDTEAPHLASVIRRTINDGKMVGRNAENTRGQDRHLPDGHTPVPKGKSRLTHITEAQRATGKTEEGTESQGSQEVTPPLSPETRNKIREIVENILGLLPPNVRAFAGNVIDKVYTNGLGVLFTHDLVNAAVNKTGISAFRKWETANKRIDASRNARMSEAADIQTEFDLLPAKQQKEVNDYLRDSTLSECWGYWEPAAFKTEAEWAAWMVKDGEEKEAEHRKMVERFNKLSNSQQAVVRKIFRYGLKTRNERANMILNQIKGEYYDLLSRTKNDERKKALIKQLDVASKKVTSNAEALKSPYAPLRRFGSHAVVVRSQEMSDTQEALRRLYDITQEQDEPSEDDMRTIKILEDRVNELAAKENDYIVEFVDGKGTARERARELQAQFPNAKVEFFARQEHDPMAVPSWQKLESVVSAIRKDMNDDIFMIKGGKGAQAIMNSLHATAMRMYVDSLSEESARKQEKHRRKVTGFNQDMMANFMETARSNATMLAQMEFGKQVRDAMGDISLSVRDYKGKDRTVAQEFENEVIRRQELAINPTSDLVRQTMRFTSSYMLLGNPAFYLQNMTQPFMMSAPFMAGRHGGGVFGRLVSTTKEVLGWMKNDPTLANIRDHLSEDEWKALDHARRYGDIDVGITQDFGDVNRRGGVVTKAINRLSETARKVEMLNRVATFLTAYRLEKAKTGNSEQARVYADSVVYQTHGDYSGFNAPRYFKANGFLKIATQFRKFQLIQAGMMLRLAKEAFKGASVEERSVGKRALAWTMCTHFLMAGATGTPFLATALGLLGWAFGETGDDDEDWLRKLIGSKTEGDLIARGLPAMLGLDLSDKVGAKTMFTPMPFYEPKSGRAGAAELALNAIGPAGNLAVKVFEASKWLSQGDYWKAIEQMMPNGVFANGSKALRYSWQGNTTKAGDVTIKPEEFSTTDLVLQAMGLPTDIITTKNRLQGSLIRHEDAFESKKAEIYMDYKKARKSGDMAGMREARRELAELSKERVAQGFKPYKAKDMVQAATSQRKREREAVSGVGTKSTNRRFMELASQR